MVIATVTKWWSRFGDLFKLNKINEIIAAINANTSGLSAVLSNDPDYDSGWISIGIDSTAVKTHNIAGNKLIFMWGKNGVGPGVRGFGTRLPSSGPQGGWWGYLSDTQISCYRAQYDTDFRYTRVLIWNLDGGA